MRRKVWFAALLGIGVFALFGCGGGGGDNGSAPAKQAVSRGAITGFGSVIVNGVEYEMTGASVSVDNSSATEGHLRVGMVVDVKGEINPSGATGTATAVVFRGNVEGPIQAIDLTAGTLTVLGQTIRIDDMTVFEGTTAGQLAVGNIVEVSGFVRADGTILAKFVEFKAPAFDSPSYDHEIEVRGQIGNLNDVAQTFEIGSLTVNYGTAVLSPPGLVLQNGLFVEVKSAQPLDAQGRLLASSIRQEERGMGQKEMEAEVSGAITRFASATDFDVNGQPVTTTAQTVFRNGAASDLALGMQLEVEGTLDAQGVLVAARVGFELARNIKIEADVAAVNAAAGTVRVLGSSPGVTVTVNAASLTIDEWNHVSPFGLADLAVGDRVSIRAFVSGGTLVASKLTRKSPPATAGQVRVQGPVDSGSADVVTSTLRVLGVTVDAGGAGEFRGANEAIITRDQFFEALAAGNVLVKVKGVLDANGKIVATELELENEHEFASEAERDHPFEFEKDGEMPHASGAEVVSKGTITALGSVFVNGVEFDTASAHVAMEGNSVATDLDFRVGMVVTVRGTVDDSGALGSASEVEFRPNLEGPIQAIDLAAGTFTVMGQLVTFDAQTYFDDVAGAAQLAVGNIVEVSGFVGADGSILATYVELVAPSFEDESCDKEIEVKGTVASLDAGAGTFLLGALTVHYTNDVLDSALTGAGGLREGLFVEVKATQPPVDNSLTASWIEAEDLGVEVPQGTRAEVEGRITQFTSPTDFAVNGQPVTTTASTVYRNGAETDLAPDVAVEVEGTFNAQGIIEALEVSFKVPAGP